MSLKRSSLSLFFVLLWTLVGHRSSFAKDPGTVFQTLFHTCGANLTADAFPKKVFEKIEPISGTLTAQKLALALNGYQFLGKSGQRLTIVSEPIEPGDNKIWIWILNDEKIPLFSASQVVDRKIMTLSHISSTTPAFQQALITQFESIIKAKLEHETSSDFKNLNIEGNWSFDPVLDLSEISFRSSKKFEKGILKFKKIDNEWKPADHSLEEYHPLLKSGVVGSSIQFAFNQPRIQTLMKSQKSVLRAENEGIATELHRAYLSAVPSGTRKIIYVANGETLALFQKYLKELRLTNAYQSSHSETIRDALEHDALVRAYPETKLGHIFLNSGWKFDDVNLTDTEGYVIEILKP